MKCGFKTEKLKIVLRKYCPLPRRSTKSLAPERAFNTKGMRGIKEKNRQKIRQFATAIKMKTEKIVRSQNAGMFLFF